MKRTLLILYFVLSVVVLADIVIEYFFSSSGLFHANVFQVRLATYTASQYATGLLLLLTLLGRTGPKLVGFSALLFALVLLQAVLTALGSPVMPHALDGFAILAVSTSTAYLGMSKLRNLA